MTYNILYQGNTCIREPVNPTTEQINWIQDYMNQFQAVLWQNTSSEHYIPGADYTDYIDELSWIDHGIVEQIAADADAFRFSYFVHKDRDGKLCSGPPWDNDRTFHNNRLTYWPKAAPPAPAP